MSLMIRYHCFACNLIMFKQVSNIMKNTKILIVSLLVLAPMLASSQSSLQKSRLEGAAKSFVENYNTGDSSSYRQYLEKASNKPVSADMVKRFYNSYKSIGVIRMQSMRYSGPNQVEVLAQDLKYSSWWKFTIKTDSLQRFVSRTLQPTFFPQEALKSGALTTEKISGEVGNYIEKVLGNDFTGNVLITRKGKIILDRSYGSDQNKLANTKNTSFGLASTGKMFTAIAILQLVDAGKLTLADSVKSIIPEIKDENVRQVTIGQLLTHTSGMGDYFEDPNYREGITNLNDPKVRRQLIEKTNWDFSSKGTYRYSNTGFLLLGDIIEHVSKTSYPQYIERHIFKVLEMKNAKAGNGSGGGEATIEDMGKFLNGLYKRKLMTPASTSQMLEFVGKDNYGYGTEHHRLGNEHIVGHSGGFINQCVELNLYTKSDQMVIILSNSNPPFGHYLSNKIKELLVRK